MNAIFASVLALGLAGSPAASESAVALSWDAPPGCPSQLEFVREVATLVEAELDVEVVDAQELTEIDEHSLTRARARVREVEGSWQLRVELVNEWGSSVRDYELRSCAAAAQLAALSISLALDPNGVLTGSRLTPPGKPVAPEPEPGPEPKPPPEPKPGPEPKPELEPSEPNPPEPDWELSPVKPRIRSLYATGPQSPGPRVGGLVRMGSGPTFALYPEGVTGYLELALGVRGRFWRVEAGGIRYFRSAVTTDADTGQSIRYARWGWQVRACGVPDVGIVEFGLCLAAEGGQTSLELIGLLDTPEKLPWLAVTPSLTIGIRLHRHVAILPQLALPFNLISTGTFADGFENISESKFVEVRTGFSIEARFP